MLEKFTLVKIKLRNEDKFIYGEIVKILSDSKLRVKCYYQPLYDFINTTYTNRLFDGYDEEMIKLDYKIDDHTFTVHEDMISELSSYEIYKIMKYDIFVNRLNARTKVKALEFLFTNVHYDKNEFKFKLSEKLTVDDIGKGITFTAKLNSSNYEVSWIENDSIKKVSYSIDMVKEAIDDKKWLILED